MWFDEDPLTDPTVHIPFLLRLRLRENRLFEAPAMAVQLDGDKVLFQDPRQSPGTPIHVSEIVSGGVEIRPAPADYQQVLGSFPGAYAIWQDEDLRELFAWTRAGGRTIEEMAERLRRPPEHIEAKASRLSVLSRAVIRPARTEPAPYHSHPDRIPGAYVVVVREPTHPADVAARAQLSPDHVFLTILNGFSTTMTDEQRESLRYDPDVEYIVDDTPPARY